MVFQLFRKLGRSRASRSSDVRRGRRRLLELEPLEDRLAPATFTVINTNDSGPGSLRQAILDANLTTDADLIDFNIPGAGELTIAPAPSLPTITHPVTIDGYTQPGSSPNTNPLTLGPGALGSNAVLRIELNGSSAGTNASGLTLGQNASGSIIRGLVINRFTNNGIQLNSTVSGVVIQGNFIGTNAAGTAALANGGSGIGNDADFRAVTATVVGGVTPRDRNVISGNTRHGVAFEGFFGRPQDNVIQGNFIGTNAAGTAVISNRGSGVQISLSDNNVIGGPNAGNVIAGTITNNNANSYNAAITLGPRHGTSTGFSALGNVVQGNYIGTDLTGTVALGNGGPHAGVFLAGANGSRIGGTQPGAGNIIVASYRILGQNPIPGLVIGGNDNEVQGNFIGTNAVGATGMGNSGSGIRVVGTGNLIGGIEPGAGNVIAMNGQHGIVQAENGSNRFIGNSIHDNALLGISLKNSGVPLPNDLGDGDTGPNSLQNYPVLTAASTAGTTTTITGSLNSTANQTFRIEFFANAAIDPSGFGEGQTFLGAADVTTDGSGNAAFSTTLATGAAAGQFITATATSPVGSTSEFSATVSARRPGSLQFSATTYSVGEADGTATITVTRSGGSDGTVTIDYSAAGITATVGQDFPITGDPLVFLDGETSQSFTVPITNDTLVEGSETIELTISDRGGGAIFGTPARATLTIVDDDINAAPTAVDDEAATSEDEAVSVSVLSNDSDPGGDPLALSVVSDTNGTAVVMDNGTPANLADDFIRFTPAAHFSGIARFFYRITDPGNLSATAKATVSVAAVADAPDLSVADATGSTLAPIPLAISAALVDRDGSESLAISVRGVPDGATLSAGADQGGGVWLLTPDQLGGLTLSTVVAGVHVLLVTATATEAANEATAATTATLTLNVTAPVTLVIRDVTVAEGNDGPVSAVFDVTLSAPSALPVVVSYATLDNTASAGTDYQGGSGTLTFAPGVTSRQITVVVNGDTQLEPEERLFVQLLNPAGATLGDGFAVGRIRNDDLPPTPQVAIGNATVVEGHLGVVEAVFTITVLDPPVTPVTVALATAQGSATAGSDYLSRAQVLTFTPSLATQQFRVRVVGDRFLEGDETFFVNVLHVSGAAVANGQGVATIVNDDVLASVSVSDARLVVGRRGTLEAVFTVSLSQETFLPVQVVVRTADGTALSGRDYRSQTQVLTFQPGGQLSQEVRVRLLGNRVLALRRTFFANLTEVINALVVDGQGQANPDAD